MRVILQSKNHSTGNGSKISAIPPVGFDCKAIYLTSVTIPYSFYNIRDSNNSVTINNVLYNLEKMNYNSNQLASSLNGICPVGVIVKFDKQHLKYKITNLNSEILTICFNTSYRLFGFDRVVVTIQPNTTEISHYIADVNDGIHSLILTANFAGPFSTLYGDKFGTNIIARIPILQRPGEMINYSDINTSRPIAKNLKDLDHFEIELYDDDRLPINLNGVDYQVELFLDLEEQSNFEDGK